MQLRSYCLTMLVLIDLFLCRTGQGAQTVRQTPVTTSAPNMPPPRRPQTSSTSSSQQGKTGQSLNFPSVPTHTPVRFPAPAAGGLKTKTAPPAATKTAVPPTTAMPKSARAVLPAGDKQGNGKGKGNIQSYGQYLTTSLSVAANVAGKAITQPTFQMLTDIVDYRMEDADKMSGQKRALSDDEDNNERDNEHTGSGSASKKLVVEHGLTAKVGKKTD